MIIGSLVVADEPGAARAESRPRNFRPLCSAINRSGSLSLVVMRHCAENWAAGDAARRPDQTRARRDDEAAGYYSGWASPPLHART